ncbi:hypothetical protein GGG87_08500 [Streptococcus sp. zg-86]|uniref:Mid-cell-anchored protein Z n=2 Tax=Streptococcus TaxID=1301 RepID=A0A6I4RUT9_9STRE|nr:hypothetical protein [Streptococcus sp. zg-86]MTB91279.1 hypothetical protein [Streptococcus sp. zg-36]MWV57052.1 hypothetical protein [Streptococcus sp. zg-70]QTH48772.1 hypothetical protein J5M87_08290 [Streptococcus sp. zg-86]
MEKHTEHPDDEEKILEFEKAKQLTVGQALRKQEEIKAGVTEEDSLLDRYIKQHREEIESKKFETQQYLPLDADENFQVEENLEETFEFQPNQSIEGAVDALAFHKVVSEEEPEVASLPDPETAEFNQFEEEKTSRKPIIVWSALGVLFVGALTMAFLWAKHAEQTNSESSTSSTSASQSSSSPAKDTNLVAFDALYASFFADKGQTKLKNSEFGKLAELKKVLDKLDTKSSAYQAAKKKYDQLEAAIKAVQGINGQFDKPVLVDGELDTSATVKEGESLSPIATGLDAVDAKLTAAINLGRSQQTATSVSGSPVAPVAPAPSAETSNESPVETSAAISGTVGQVVVGSHPLYGMAIPAGVTLQRNLSRVPYDQVKIADATNSAWSFNPGILEHIIAVSQERGYISGYNYILEPVNIINGNGYYNLFRPDGTYLFSMNAKTGYFVGNGAGYADDLDY